MKIQRIKILIALILAFVISNTLDNQVFLVHSPKIRPSAINLVSKEKAITTYMVGYKESSVDTKNLVNYLLPITKGVSAASQDNKSLTKYNLNDVEWIEINYRQADNVEIKIRTPKNMPK